MDRRLGHRRMRHVLLWIEERMKKPAHTFKWMPVKLVWKNERRCIYCGLSAAELKRIYERA